MEAELLKVVAGLFSRQFFRSTSRVGAIRGGGELFAAKSEMTGDGSRNCAWRKNEGVAMSTLPIFSTREHVLAIHRIAD